LLSSDVQRDMSVVAVAECKVWMLDRDSLAQLSRDKDKALFYVELQLFAQKRRQEEKRTFRRDKWLDERIQTIRSKHPVAEDLTLASDERIPTADELLSVDFACHPLTIADVRQAIKFRTIAKNFRNGDSLDQNEEALARGVFVLLHGRVSVETSDIDGGKKRVLKRGAVFSQLAAVHKVKKPTGDYGQTATPLGKGATDGVQVSTMKVTSATASCLWIDEDLFLFAHQGRALQVVDGTLAGSSDEDESEDDEEDIAGTQQSHGDGLARVNARLDAQQQTLDELKALLLSLQPQAQAQAQAQTSSPASHSSSRAHSSGGGRVQQLVAQNGAVRFDEKATVEVAEVGVPPALPPSLQVRHSSHAERHEAIQRMLADDANSD
jgi:CRP-like cAMP-binding protein